MKITRIQIVQGSGADYISALTDLPSPCPNFDPEPLALHFETARSEGPAYVERHFPGVPVSVTQRPKTDYSFSRYLK